MIKILLVRRKFERGALVFKEGEPGNEAYLIRNGYVLITKEEDGKTVELASRGSGEIIGEMALLDDRPRSATVTAKTDVEMEVITRGDIKKLMEHIPDTFVLIIEQLLKRLRDANELIAMYGPARD